MRTGFQRGDFLLLMRFLLLGLLLVAPVSAELDVVQGASDDAGWTRERAEVLGALERSVDRESRLKECAQGLGVEFNKTQASLDAVKASCQRDAGGFSLFDKLVNEVLFFTAGVVFAWFLFSASGRKFLENLSGEQQ